MTDKFEQWCLVELMGHQKIAGKCSEVSLAGANMLRVDVPEYAGSEAFTRFYSSSAVYAIHPISEQIARGIAERLEAAPINAWEARRIMDSFESKVTSDEMELARQRLVANTTHPYDNLGYDDDHDDDEDEDNGPF